MTEGKPRGSLERVLAIEDEALFARLNRMGELEAQTIKRRERSKRCQPPHYCRHRKTAFSGLSMSIYYPLIVIDFAPLASQS
jgi:hypothetical protein